jgi:hypothetical protein
MFWNANGMLDDQNLLPEFRAELRIDRALINETRLQPLPSCPGFSSLPLLLYPPLHAWEQGTRFLPHNSRLSARHNLTTSPLYSPSQVSSVRCSQPL